jgi:hypothetical protein
MNRLIVLNRFFYPDHSATSQILTDLRLHFAASGVDVHVITSQQLYDDPSRQLPQPKRPQRKCVHSAQPRERPASPHPSDYVDEDFGIAPGRKIAPESFQFGAQLRMVVNFAVKSNNPAVAHFPHGLVAQTPRFNDR